MKKIERIKRLMETQQQTIDRLSKEVTNDPCLEKARNSRDAFKQCLTILESDGEQLHI